MNTLITNSAFAMRVEKHPVKLSNLYVFELLPGDAQQVNLDLLHSSLAMICSNESGIKSSVILDCSLLKNNGLIQRFIKLCFKKLVGIDNRKGLDKLVIVTSSGLVSVMSKSIIKLKKAEQYSKVCSTMAEALEEI